MFDLGDSAAKDIPMTKEEGRGMNLLLKSLISYPFGILHTARSHDFTICLTKGVKMLVDVHSNKYNFAS